MVPAPKAVEIDRFESIIQTSRSGMSAEGSSYCWAPVFDSLLCLAGMAGAHPGAFGLLSRHFQGSLVLLHCMWIGTKSPFI